MLSRILFAFLFLLPGLASASLSSEEMTKELAGRYKLETEAGTIQFLLRSSGAVEVFENDQFNGLTGSITSNFSESDWGLSGLPVAHVVLGSGSDEDWTDYHILLSIEQDGRLNKISVISLFSTFNDGPNETSTVGRGGLKLYKFNKSTDKFFELK